MPDNQDNPSVPGVVHERQQEPLTIVSDLYEGTLRLREKAKTYLPEFPREPDDAYEDRVRTAVLFNAFRRTVQGLVGMVFRKDPEIGDDVSEDIRDQADNIDQAGRSLDVFARDVFEHGVRDGHSHIFVDMQRLDREFQNELEEEQAGRRPYWVNILKGDVLSFRATRIAGEHVLTQFVYRETVVTPDGEFKEQEVDRFRVYRLISAESSDGVDRDRGTAVAFEVWQPEDPDAAGSDLIRVDRGVMDISRIPLSTFYANRTGLLESSPPMLDLALENVKHFQIRSDRDNGIHVTNNPVPVFVGIEADDVTVGSNVGIAIPDVNGDAKYMEPAGKGLASAQQELQDIEQRMAALGLAMLQRDTRAAETAEARRIEKSETDSNLATAARGLQQSLVEAVEFHAEWLDQEDGAGQVTVNRDFESQMMPPQMVQSLASLVDTGKLSLETMWDLLERGEVLPAGFDREQEMARLSGGGMNVLERFLRSQQPAGGEGNGAGAEAGVT